MPNPPHQAKNPEITSLPATAPIEEIANVIRRDGGIIIKGFVAPEDIDQMDAESAPWFEKLRTLKYEGHLFPPSDPPLRYDNCRISEQTTLDPHTDFAPVATLRASPRPSPTNASITPPTGTPQRSYSERFRKSAH